MVREICRDEAFLAQKAEPATPDDLTTAADLLELEVADRIIPEPEGGAHTNPAALFRTLDTALVKELNALGKLSGPALAAGRYKKFRAMGAKALRKERT